MGKVKNLTTRTKIFIAVGALALITLVIVLSVWGAGRARLVARAEEYQQTVARVEKAQGDGEKLLGVCAENLTLEGENWCESRGLDQVLTDVKQIKPVEDLVSIADFDREIDYVSDLEEKLDRLFAQVKTDLEKDAQAYVEQTLNPLLEEVGAKVSAARELIGKDGSESGIKASFKTKIDDLAKLQGQVKTEIGKDETYLGQLQEFEAGLKSAVADLAQAQTVFENALDTETEKQADTSANSGQAGAKVNTGRASANSVTSGQSQVQGQTRTYTKQSTPAKPATPSKPATPAKPAAPAKPSNTNSNNSGNGGSHWVEEDIPVEMCGGGDEFGNSWEVPCP